MTTSAFFSFPRPFYVINGIELFERGAFYSMNYVLAAYMARTLSLPDWQVGVVTAVMLLFLYVLPFLGTPISEKFGYRNALFASFILLAGGYTSLLFATTFPTLLGSVVVIGLGAALFKPIAAAVVAQTSTPEKRDFAFIIYYGAINIGATVVPLALALGGLILGGAVAKPAFLAAAIISAMNVALVFGFWDNLRTPQRETSLASGFANLKAIFGYPKLITLLVIYSGFWFLYAMSLSFLAVYMLDFTRMPSWFNELFLGVVNPAVIVLVAPFMSPFTSRFKSLQLMVVGISLYVVGFLAVGFSSTQSLFLVGVVIFSVGEVLTHPAFLSYVSKFAPPGRESMFLAYGFLPIAVGLFFGAIVGGILYGELATTRGQPALFWAIMSAVALVTVAALILYNHFVSPKARSAARGPGEPRRRGVFAAGTFGLAALALLLVPALILAAGAIPSAQPIEAANTDGGDALDTANLVTADLPDTMDTAKEGAAPVEVRLMFPASATGEAKFTLTWTDEEPDVPAATNAPDTFKIHVMRPDGTAIESKESSSGSLELAISDAGPGEYVVHVELVNAGDVAVVSPPLGPAIGESEDTSNEFTLAATHQAAA